MTAYRRELSYIFTRINCGTRFWLVMNFSLQSLYSWGRNTVSPVRGWTGYRAFLDVLEKRLLPVQAIAPRFRRLPAFSLFPVPTELSHLKKLCWYSDMFTRMNCSSPLFDRTAQQMLPPSLGGDNSGTCRSAVVEAPRLCRGFNSRLCHWNFSLTQSFRPHYGPGVDSACKRYEYQEYFMKVRAAGALDWQTYHLHVAIALKSGNLKLLETCGLSRSVIGLLYPFT